MFAEEKKVEVGEMGEGNGAGMMGWLSLSDYLRPAFFR